jgi:uncharacterized membrane protein YukC
MLTNIIRVVALAISTSKQNSFVNLEQHDLFNYIIYGLIFILWIIWIRYVVPGRTKKQLASN